LPVTVNASRLKSELARRGLTQAEFAVRAGVVPNTVSNVMTGKPVTQAVLHRMVIALQNTPVISQIDDLIAV